MNTARYLAVCVDLPRGSNVVVINDEEASVNGEGYFLFEIVNFDEPLRTEILTAMAKAGSDKARKSIEIINKPKTDYDSPEYIRSMPESDLKLERQREAVNKEIVNKFQNDAGRQRRARNFRDYIKLNDIPQVLSDIGNSSEALEDAVFVLNKLRDYGLIDDWRFNYVASKIGASVPDPYIGRKWNSRQGEAEIIGERGDTYMVRYGDTVYFEPKPTIDRTILVDEDGYKSLLRQREQELEQSRKEAEKKSARYEDYGFTNSITGIKKERIIEALNKIVSWNGVVKPRKDQIVDAIKSGSKVMTMRLGGKPTRVLVDTEGAFFDEPVVTKIGMDFAQYLIDSGVVL